MVKPAFAQTPTPTPIPIPTPSVPEFTIQPVGPPTLVNTTYSLDQNTGQIVAQIGYTNEYSAVNITIKNQPYNSASGFLYLHYNIRIKDHNEADNWTDLYNADEENYPTQSTDSDYTTISIPIPTIPAGTQTDIQVEAMIGYYETHFNGNPSPQTQISTLVGETSGWSDMQTVTIPANTPLSTTPAPSSSTSTLTPTPTAKSSLLLITTVALVVIAFLLAIIIFLVLYMRKRRIAFSQTKHTLF
jgi:hypothetical protein